MSSNRNKVVRAVEHVSISLERILGQFAAYVVPIVIGFFVAAALFVWPPTHPGTSSTPLSLLVIKESLGSQWTPAQAIDAIEANGTALVSLGTGRSEDPFWILLHPPVLSGTASKAIEFPSRHLKSAECWNRAGALAVGRISEGIAAGDLHRIKAGFFLPSPVEGYVLCRIQSVGPAQVSARLWNMSDLAASALGYERDGGLLEGGMLVLSIFVFLVALINREWIYVIFAAWLAANLRTASLSAGWDTSFLEHAIPFAWITPMRQLTMATYFVLTGVLFGRLFLDDLKALGYLFAFRLLLWTCPAVLGVALVLPYQTYLPVLWIISAVGILGLAALLLAIVVRRGSRVAIWYGLSLGIMFLSTLYEIIAASFGSRDLIGSINSVTAGLAASIIVALAIAEQLHQEKLQRVKAQFALNHTYETIPIGLFTLDKAGVFVNSNPGIRAILGRRFDEHEFPHWSDFLDPAAWRILQQRLRFEPEVEVEVAGAGAGNEGHERRFLIKAASSNDLVEGSLQDITERHKAVTQLKHLSEHDSLTGVLNRRGIEARVKDALRRIDVDHPLAIGYLDLDRFKLINDLYGHPTGDRVLQETCSRITAIMRSDDRNLIGRVGGDEFLLAFPEASIGKAEEICQKIISTVEATPCQIGPRAFQVRCSIGVLEAPSGTLVKDAISLSDQACRSAKRSVSHLSVLRRDAHEVAGHTEEMGLIRRFGTDMPPDGLFLDMQPIMSLTAPLASLNFEMLIRMRQPDQSVTPAWKIISAAEHNGRISVIDRWVLETTLQWLDAHRHRLSNTQFVCLNLSGASLNDERFIHDAFAMLDNYRQVASCLCLEITETVALHDMNNTRRFIDRVREFDAKIALDDFGAGYTSFSYLKQLATDVLKIDGMFVRDVTVHPANLSIVQAITELAHNLGMKTVAEWAEDLATVQALASIGVDYVQGYAISRPTTPQQILSATSSASLIVDPEVAHYVTRVLSGDSQRRDQTNGNSPSTQGGLAAILRDDDGHLIH